MQKITDKKLIESISQLKEIKPRKEWASLLKSQILAEEQIVAVKAESVGFMNVVSSMFFQRKMAYSFAVILLLALGIFGAVSYKELLLPSDKVAEKSVASLTTQTAIKQNVIDLNTKINDLAKATKDSSIAINEINTKVSALAKSFKNIPVSDPQTVNEIVKTLADVPGTDLIANADPDVNTMMQAVVQSQIADLQKTTLTDDQKKTLADAEDLYNQGKYGDAFEEIYGINQQTNNLP
jgi:hypothetical protein